MNYNKNDASIRFEVEYKAVKTMRLTVYPPDGRVKITAPFGTAPEGIKKFAESKIQWIIKHRQKFINKSKTSVPVKNNSTVYLWGTPYELEIIEREGYSKIVPEGGKIKMYVRPGSTKAKKQEIFDKWYSKILKGAAPEIIEKWEAKIGVNVNKLYVQKMKTHWGSCNYGKQTLRLNSELAKRSPECLDYVILHEMLHIIEKGHNQNFYRFLNKFMPAWKSIRKKMNSGEL
jgi:predicted metal-dependent hydrolase